jgi:hypothetical protein
MTTFNPFPTQGGVMYHTKITIFRYILSFVVLMGFTQLIANSTPTEKNQIAWDGYYGGHGGGHYHGARHYDYDAGFYEGNHGYDNVEKHENHGKRYWKNQGWEHGLVYGQDLSDEDEGVITIPFRGAAPPYYYYPVLVNQPDYTYFYMTYPD